MTNAAVAADFDKSLDIECCFSSEITFDLNVVVDVFTELGNLVLCEVFNSRVGINTGSRNNIVCGLGTYTVDVSETDLDSLISGQVDT